MKIVGRIAAMAVAVLLGLGVFAAAADAYPDNTNSRVGPSGGRSAVADPADPGDPGAQAAADLPFTGGDVLGLVAIGAVLAGTGFVVVYSSRRRRHALS